MGFFLNGQQPRAPSLRDLLAGPEPILAPGAYDALSARLIEAAGFRAVYMTGFGTAASLLGRPDVGLLGMSEMVDNARRIVQAVAVPVIADADTGYGNPISVIRTVHEYERAGVGAIHIEDQLAPKKCGHLEGKQLVPAEDMVAKLRAAVAARRSDLVLIARTDAPRAAYAKFSRPFARMARPRRRSPGCRASANSPSSSACPKSRSWSSSSAACRSKRGVEWQAHLASTA